MKIFHTENGKEAVYVQMQDIMELNRSDTPILASIYMKVFKGIVIVDDTNRFDFVRFDDEEEVKFFKEVDFIIDYNEYKDMTDDQLENEWGKLVTKSNEIAKKWNEMSEDEREKISIYFKNTKI